MTNLEHGKEVAPDEELLRRRIKLWFFRDLSDTQRLALFRLTMHDIPGRELETHLAQNSGLSFVLDALRRPSPSRVTDGVKPLEWQAGSVHHPDDMQTADIAFDYHYFVGRVLRDPETWECWVGIRHGGDRWWRSGQHFLSMSEAKAAAQSDYETRIRSALTSVEGGQNHYTDQFLGQFPADWLHDLPEAFEAWWHNDKRKNRDPLPTYSEKKQLAWDAYFRARLDGYSPTPTEAVPSGVTEEMVAKFKAAYIAETGSTMWPTDRQFRSILTAALAASQPVPQRAEGAN